MSTSIELDRLGGPVEVDAFSTRPDKFMFDHPQLKTASLIAALKPSAEKLQSMVEDARVQQKIILAGPAAPTPTGKTPAEKIEAIDAMLEGFRAKLTSDAKSLSGASFREQARSRERALFSPDIRLKLPSGFEHEESTGTMERETRDELRKIGNQERYLILFDAAKNDDRITLRAFQFAPARFPLIEKDQLDQATRLHVETLWPEQLEEAEELYAVSRLAFRNLERACLILQEIGKNRIIFDAAKIAGEKREEINPYMNLNLARPAGK